MSEEDPSTVVSQSQTSLAADQTAPSAVALTIVWHADPARIGAMATLGQRGLFQISRRTAPFELIADVQLSRAAFLEVAVAAASVELRSPASSTAVTVGGQPLREPRLIREEELRSGAIITVADAIVVCLHRVQVPVLRGPSLGMIGSGDAIEAVRRRATMVADLEVPVLVTGETGTGKELVARAIVANSSRAAGPFVAVNMAAIPSSTAVDELFGHEKGAFTGASEARPGYFVEADGGTLFLDEVGATPPDVQKMLLRALETGEIRPLGARRARKVDVRVLSATDTNLAGAVRAGAFNEPLLHRLSAYQIAVPPLRERREDVGALLLSFLREELAAIAELDRLDRRLPPDRPWLLASDVARIAAGPLGGNIRALRNRARQIVISSRGQGHAVIDSLPAGDADGGTAGTPASPGGAANRSKVSDEEIEEALRRRNYNFSAAAEDLGIHRSTLYERVHQNPRGVRSAAELSDDEILLAHARHAGDVTAMAAELRVSPKPLKARLTEALARNRGR